MDALDVRQVSQSHIKNRNLQTALQSCAVWSFLSARVIAPTTSIGRRRPERVDYDASTAGAGTKAAMPAGKTKKTVSTVLWTPTQGMAGLGGSLQVACLNSPNRNFVFSQGWVRTWVLHNDAQIKINQLRSLTDEAVHRRSCCLSCGKPVFERVVLFGLRPRCTNDQILDLETSLRTLRSGSPDRKYPNPVLLRDYALRTLRSAASRGN
eukprot:834481-Pleurochrysis_carterae.AAC.1